MSDGHLLTIDAGPLSDAFTVLAKYPSTEGELPDLGDGVLTYFIQGAEGGPIKIGRSTQATLAARVSTIQTGYPDRLVVRMLVQGDYERRFHNAFYALRMTGEWFRARGDLPAICGAIPDPDATGDARTLDAEYDRGFEDGWRALINEMLADGLLVDSIQAAVTRETAEYLTSWRATAASDAATYVRQHGRTDYAERHRSVRGLP